ncbi:MAG: glycoside hydrolase family 9 protein [Candidatus Sigynarchaeota archaeon]
MERRDSVFKDTWGALFLIGIPVLAFAAFIWVSYAGNYDTVHGRYHYTGSETMSMLGLLDLAHYRNVGINELLGWQFFFGNLPFFVIYALLMTGFLHLARPRAISMNGTEPSDIKPGKGLKRFGALCGIVAAGIVVAEIAFSAIGNPQTGLGSHLYVGDFYRDIPTLLSEGFYTTNNIPAIPQMVMTLVPVACGLGIFFYVNGISGFRAQGNVARKLKVRPAAVIMLVVALAWWMAIAANTPIRVQEAVTGYSAIMMLVFLLNALIITGILLPATRSMLPSAPCPFRVKIRPAALIVAIAAVGTLVASGLLVLWPALYIFEIDVPEIPCIAAFQVSAIIAFIVLVAVLVVLSRKDYVEIVRVVSFFGGLFAFLMLAVYFALNPDGGNIEIMWLYNAIIPSVFLNALVIALYMLGFKINDWIKALKNAMTRKMPALHGIFESPNTRKLEAIATVFLVAGFGTALPAFIGEKILGDHPRIILNNVGMLPNQEKTFFIALKNDMPGVNGTFDVVDRSGRVVYTGILCRQGPLWRDHYWKGDFSSLATEGNYRVIARLGQHVTTSNEFAIDANYLDAARHLSLYWFYYARCGTKVLPVQHNAIGHEACHLNDAWYLYNNSGTYEYRHDLNLTGGWHDSGDYNTYGSMMAMAIYSLAYSMNQSFSFLNEPENRAAYPQNDSIPDIYEEAWFGIQWWMKRFYEPEQRFFDSNCLGENMSIRWTVFAPPEFEEFFGNGRWVVGDPPPTEDMTYAQAYKMQFLQSPWGLLPAASAAALARQFKAHGFFNENVTQLEAFANKTRNAYKNYLNGGWESIACEAEMYRLTGNMTYFDNARGFVNNVIAASGSMASFPGEPRLLALAIQFAQQFNGTGGWDGLGYLAGNKTADHLAQYISARTDDPTNYFKYLRKEPFGAPVDWNFGYLNMIFAASYAFNISSNSTTRKSLYNFMTRHFDWLFGRNMENTCMMERLPGGDVFVQNYATRQRFIPGNLHGAFPGAIADGFRYFPGDYGAENSLDNRERNPIIPHMSNMYTETWSWQANAFQFAIGAFFSQVLGRA